MDKNNFFISSRATFIVCKRPTRQPNHVSFDKYGNVSSEYWYTKTGVIRCSKHWSRAYVKAIDNTVVSIKECHRVSSCYWVLRGALLNSELCGFARWDAFVANNPRKRRNHHSGK